MKSPTELRSSPGRARSILQSCTALGDSLKVFHRSAQRSQELQNLTLLDGTSWMHLHNCWCFQEHLRMLLQSLRALCLASGRSGSVWKYLEALVRLPGVSERIVCCVRTKLHFADHCSSGATTIGHIVYYIIAALYRLCLHSSLKQRITSA